MFKQVLSWLLGKTAEAQRQETSQDLKLLNQNAPLQATPAQAAPSPTAGKETFICREAVLGRDQRVAGYHFHLQESSHNNVRRESPVVQHFYAELLIGRLVERQVSKLLGHRLIFIDVPASFLGHPSLLDLPPAQVVLLLLSTPVSNTASAPHTEALVQQLQHLRQLGFRVALTDPLVFKEWDALLPQADLVMLRAPGVNPAHAHQLIQHLTTLTHPVELMVRDLPALEDFRFCYQLGAQYFQGPFVTSREDWSDGKLSTMTTTVMSLIDLLRREADTQKLAELFKRDAALSLRLLRYINAAAHGLSVQVNSIPHALTLLGRDHLKRWLVLLACTAGSHGARSSAALEAALIRARMMELVGHRFSAAEREQLFLIGLLSLVDVVLQIPLDKALAPMGLAPEIHATLVQEQGRWRPWLNLAIAYEKAESGAMQVAALECGISPWDAAQAQHEALAWALEMQNLQA